MVKINIYGILYNRMVNDMEEKKADNTINKQKVRIKEIDNKIDIEKDKTKQLDEIEEIVVSLNKNINKCLELLGVSMNLKTMLIIKRILVILNSIEK